MGAYTENAGRFEISRVIGRTLSLIGGNALLFTGLAVAMLLPLIVLLFAAAMVTVPAERSGNPGPVTVVVGFVFLIGWLVANGLLQAAVAQCALTRYQGGKPEFRNCVGTTMSLIFPLTGVILVSYGAVMFGFMLAFFPGVIAACVLLVAIPALVEDRRGVRAALGRSATLTRGARWKIFALLLIYAVCCWAGAAILAMLDPLLDDFAILAVNLGALILMAMVTGAGTASVYLELRAGREGGTFQDLAAVFA